MSSRLLRWVCGIVFALLLLGAFGLEGLVVFPIKIALHLVLGWISFVLRVLPETHLNPAAVGFFLVVSCLAVAGIHWLGRSLSTSRGSPWRRRWTLGIYASTWLLFLTAMGVTGVAHQAGWLWRGSEPWFASRYSGLRAYGAMNLVGAAIQAAVHDQTRDVSEIRSLVIADSLPYLDTCQFQLFPPEGGAFRAAVVLPRSQELLKKDGFLLLRKNGNFTDLTRLKKEDLERVLEDLTAGRQDKPASDPVAPRQHDPEPR